jgi:CHAT domain-containing protein
VRAASSSLAPAEGLSAAFIYGGALGCIGNTWPVHDTSAADFAVRFYKHLVSGHTLGKAMLRARQEMHDANRDRLTWAGFVLFGNPLFRMNWTPERRPAP